MPAGGPTTPALAEGDRVYASWGEFAARTAGAATSLRDHFGLSPGDRVAIVMRNRPEYLEALFAIWRRSRPCRSTLAFTAMRSPTSSNTASRPSP